MIDIRPQPGAQTRFLASNADFAIYGGSAGSGKAAHIETLIPTLNGIKSLYSIQEGDILFDEHANTCRVLSAFEIYQAKQAYKIVFDDSSEIIVDGEHLWTISGYGEDGNLFRNLTINTNNLFEIPKYSFGIISYWIERPYEKEKWRYVTIRSIEPTKSVLVRCLEVDSPSHLFLCGQSGIPTHNSYALLLEASRHINNPGFGAVIFRREQKMIVCEGGLRDTAMEIYPHLGGQYRAQPTPSFIFPSGAKISFAHLNQESEVLNWQGSQIPMIGYDELTHFCVDDQTEALTEDGWKLIKDIQIGERVASLSKDREVQYQKVTHVYENDYSGEMVVANKGLNFKVTPNHRMVVNVADTGLIGKAAFGSWKFIEAKDLVTCSIPRVGNWCGEEIEYQYFDPIEGRGYGAYNTNSDIEVVPIDDWLSFLGWYFSEGRSYRMNNRTRSCVVCIRQMKHNGQALLEQVLDRLPWRYSKTKDGQYHIFSRQLYEELVDFGNTYQKRVPRWIFKLSPRLIKLFLDTFAYGDGYVTRTNGISIGLANEGLIDDLQELYFLCGRVSVKGHYVAREQYNVWTLYVSNPKRTHFFLHHNNLYSERYEGKIYCLTVNKNQNFLMRRNGRFCWTGNSAFQHDYMISRMRSTCGIRPYCRATTNPDSDSWVANLLTWWIDQETGFPIAERSGVLRYFIRVNGEMKWADSRQELVDQWGCELSDPKSLTFISARITDNPILLKKDPAYLGNLKALSKVERARLLDGNWKIRAVAGMYFPREDGVLIDWQPQEHDIVKWVRSWDLAASEESDGRDPDWTVGMLLGRRQNGKVVIADVIRVRRKAAEVRSLIRNLAVKDGKNVWISIPQDPGQAGRDQADSYKQLLSGFTVLSRSITKNKTTMAEPAAALWQQGNIEIVRAAWNEELLAELEQFPEGKHDDLIDSLSAGVRALPGHAKPDYSKTGLSGRFKEIRSVGEKPRINRVKKV